MEFYFGGGGSLRKALRELVEKAEALCKEEAECVGHPVRGDKANCPLAETRAAILKAKEVLPQEVWL